MNCRWLWNFKGRSLDLSSHGLIMGILNVTPDSFFDGGRFASPSAALDQGARLLEEGADLIDVGGESTRPGALPVDEDGEIDRILPVIQGLRKLGDFPISIDTSKPEVARAALEAGADIINDITGFTDPAMVELAVSSDCGLVVMHMQGRPQTMQTSPNYQDVVGEVGGFLSGQIDLLAKAGIARERILPDPGIGFGKSPAHNAALLGQLESFAFLERPLLLGVSRKSFLGWATGSREMDDRFWPGVALTSLCRNSPARVFRVHEPQPHRDALRVTEAILQYA